MKKRISHDEEYFYRKLISGMITAINVFLLFIIIVGEWKFEYPWKEENCIKNIFLIIVIFILGMGIFYIVKTNFGKKLLQKFEKVTIKNKWILLYSIIVFAFQIYVSKSIWFKTGWDCEVLVNTAFKIAEGQKLDNHWYFNIYPNNVTLTYIFAMILKVGAIFNVKEPYFLLILFGCLSVNLSGVFLILTARRILEKNIWCNIIALFWIVLTSLSPWIVIPYSDTYCIVFPILLMYLYTFVRDENKKSWLIWGIICAVTYLGYLIKPTVAIVFIAMLTFEIWSLCFGNSTIKRKNVLKKIIIMIGALGICIAAHQRAGIILGYNIDKEQNVSVWHYGMLGANYETSGTYSDADVGFSISFVTSEERKIANQQEWLRRIKDMGGIGLIKHLCKKTLINFNDGSFSWGQGWPGIYLYEQELPELPGASFLRECCYPEGKYYEIWKILRQTIWLLVLLLMLGNGICNETEEISAYIVGLSVVGFTIFLMIFEARARYVYCFSPVFILCAAIGGKRIANKFRSWKMRIEPDGGIK